ncbi:uncharacterized protein LOC119587915 [Penaeus monodon]|uniref:uncharacterized protein LOC119587915 n=1 Tax=Penaeus monodon TaxID=6687 RepID=UPI0018A77647|nr:uncharacterized protein LOC119587915 [Penaeus monodon]
MTNNSLGRYRKQVKSILGTYIILAFVRKLFKTVIVFPRHELCHLHESYMKKRAALSLEEDINIRENNGCLAKWLPFISECSPGCVSSLVWGPVYYGLVQEATFAVPANKLAVPQVYCSIKCALNPNCKFYVFRNGDTCVLYSFFLDPGYVYSGPDPTVDAYAPPAAYDLALMKLVTASSCYASYYGQWSSLVDGKHCRIGKNSCVCTSPTTNTWITVDLGATYAITEIVVTVSMGLDQPFFVSTNIHVGDGGTYQSDPVVVSKDAIQPLSYETLRYPVSASGRYVTFHKASGMQCFCHIKVFGN